MPNTRRSNRRINTRRRNTRRSNTRRSRRVRRNTRRSRRVRSNTRRSRRVRSDTRRSNIRSNTRRNKRGKGDVPMDMVVPELGDFDDIGDIVQEMEAKMDAEKRLAWMKITKGVMKIEGPQQQQLITDIAEMVALLIP